MVVSIPAGEWIIVLSAWSDRKEHLIEEPLTTCIAGTGEYHALCIDQDAESHGPASRASYDSFSL